MFQIVTQHREVRVTGKLFSGLNVRAEKNPKPVISFKKSDIFPKSLLFKISVRIFYFHMPRQLLSSTRFSVLITDSLYKSRCPMLYYILNTH